MEETEALEAKQEAEKLLFIETDPREQFPYT